MIGAEIRAQRARTSVGLRELSRRAGVHPGNLCDIEKGARTPSPPTLVRLAAALECAPDRWLWLWAVEHMTEPLALKAAGYGCPSGEVL